MPTFIYSAIDSGGVKSAGDITADSKSIGINELSARGLMVITIKEKATEISFGNLSRRAVGVGELERFTAELGVLLKNGVRIDRGLTVLLRNTTNPSEQRFLRGVLDSVRRGESLSQALAEFPDLFSDTYLNIVRTGEASGRLADIFMQLAEDLKFSRQLRNQIIQALTYPAVIMFVCLLSVIFVFNYIVPQMEPLFAGAASLPGYTQALLATSEWFRNYQWYLLILFALFVFLVARSFRSRSQRDRLFSHLMRWPLVGRLVLMVNQIQANSTLNTTLASGLSVDQAFALAAKSVVNRELQQSLMTAQERIRRGESPSKALRGNPLYPDFSHSLIEVGEESGDLQPCFEELADRARSDFQLRVAQLTSILEPLLILVMGGIVGGVVVTMLLSVVSVNDISL